MNEKNKVKRGGFENIKMKRRRREKGEDMYEKNKVKRGGFNNINVQV